MAGPYSHRQFFRHVPNPQLSAYFKSNDVDLGIDLIKLKEKEVDTVFNAFMALPEQQQATIEAQFQDINAMASEGGVVALIDEAEFHEDDAFVEAISAIEGFHAKVMWAFLEKQDYWRGATMFLHAD